MTATTRPAKSLRAFANHLFRDEKSPITVDKYLRDAGAFLAFLNGKRISKTEVIHNPVDYLFSVPYLNQQVYAHEYSLLCSLYSGNMQLLFLL